MLYSEADIVFILLRFKEYHFWMQYASCRIVYNVEHAYVNCVTIHLTKQSVIAVSSII